MVVKRKTYTVSFKLLVAEHLIRYGSARGTAREFGINDRQFRDWAGSVDQLYSQKKSAKQLPGTGRPLRDQSMDDTLAEWFDLQRKQGLGVTSLMLKRKAELEGRARGLNNFKASDGWLRSFKRRHCLSLCSRTSLAQKLPHDFEEKLNTILLYSHFL